MKEKQDEAALLPYYNEIDISLRNTNFPNELTADPNVTYNLLENNILSSKEKHLIYRQNVQPPQIDKFWFTNVWSTREKTQEFQLHQLNKHCKFFFYESKFKNIYQI